MGRRQLERNSQLHFGLSPKQFSGRERVQLARQLIKGQSLQEKTAGLVGIAMAAGYSNQAHFSKSFVRSMEITPRKYANGLNADKSGDRI